MSNLRHQFLIPSIARSVDRSTPGSVANLALWFDATRITGLADGDAVAQWDDLSGGNHAVQVTGTKQPLFKTGIQGGLPGLLFDNTDDNLRTGNFTANVAGITVFAVAKSGTAAGIIVESGTVWTTNNGFSMSRDAADRALVTTVGAVGQSTANSGTATISTTRQFTGVYDKSLASAEVSVFADGVDKTATVANSNNLDTIMTAAQPINIGSRNAGASAPINGYIHEILIYLRAVTSGERLSIEAYLKNKWKTP